MPGKVLNVVQNKHVIAEPEQFRPSGPHKMFRAETGGAGAYHAGGIGGAGHYACHGLKKTAFACAAAPADQKRVIGRGCGVGGQISGRCQRKSVFVIADEVCKGVFRFSRCVAAAVRSGGRADGLRQSSGGKSAGSGAFVDDPGHGIFVQPCKMSAQCIFKGSASVQAEPVCKIHVRKNHPQGVFFLAQGKALQPGFSRCGPILRQYFPQFFFQHNIRFIGLAGHALWIKALPAGSA